MAQRKPYNPNTPYGRRKIREQIHREAEEAMSKLSPAERLRIESESKWMARGVVLVLILLAGLIVFIVGGKEGFFKWLTR